MPNTNCLKGMNCPGCGSEGRFIISVQTLMEVSDDGTGNDWDTEWGDNSYCECKSCGYSGKVKNFTILWREMDKVRRTKKKNLPLLIGTLTTEEAEKALEERMK